ncbi:pyridoxamine 5'-phosphate oxidase [soil metagenome]
MAPDLGHFREQYDHGVLHRADLAADPVEQFSRWWDAWTAEPRHDAAACVLATAGATGVPTARYVLVRGFSAEGFDVYTNYGSRKAQDLRANPRAALVFGWLAMDRQVRVEGPVAAVDDATADAYWASRPRGSQLGAWASDQSGSLVDRSELERHRDDAVDRFGADDGGAVIPRPPYWGGYRVGVERMEFWQGRRDRLHDRFEYRRDADRPDRWHLDRLAP